MRGGSRLVDLAAALTIVFCLIGLAMILRDERIIASDAHAVDGDTLALRGRRVRLRGLDAPELGQTCQRGAIPYRCGEEARAALRSLIAGRTLGCVLSGRDKFDRALGICRVDGEDIGAALVRRGLAVSFGAYLDEEREAREARRGIWAGPFEMPQAWRRRHDAERRP